MRSPGCRKGKLKGEARRDTAHPSSLLCAGTTAWSKRSTQLQAVLFGDATSQSTALCAFSSIHPCALSLSLFGHALATLPIPPTHTAPRRCGQPPHAQSLHTATSLKQSHPYMGPQTARGRGAALQPQRGKRSSKKKGDYAKINQQEHSLRLRPRHSSRDITIRAVTPGTPWKQQGSQPCVLQAQQPLSPACAGRSCVPQAGPSMHPQHLSLVMGLSVDDTCFSFGPKYTIWLEPRRLDPTEIKLRSARRGGSGFLLSFHPELPLAPSEKESCSQPRHAENCSSQRGQSLAP